MRGLAVLFGFGLLGSCGGSEVRDVHDYGVQDYTRRLADPDYRPDRPRRRGVTDYVPGAKQELLYRRAALYQREARTAGHAALKLGLADMEECIPLFGERALAAHYELRAALRAALQLEHGVRWQDADVDLQREVLSSANREALRLAADDYARSLALTKELKDCASIFESRGRLYYAMGEAELAAADFQLVAKLDQKLGGTSTAWEKLRRLYGELKAAAATRERKDQVEYFAALQAQASSAHGASALGRPRETSPADAKARIIALERAYAQRKTCPSCTGSGKTQTFDPATTAPKWNFERDRDSKWGQGSCPQCYGRGYTMPGTDD
jgi:hypothetical protein